MRMIPTTTTTRPQRLNTPSTTADTRFRNTHTTQSLRDGTNTVSRTISSGGCSHIDSIQVYVQGRSGCTGMCTTGG